MQWSVDTTHAEIGFSVKHLMISTVKGRFNKFTGSGTTDADGSLKSVEMTIDASSIDTNTTQRDDHLRSPDFFDVPNHPTIRFSSTGIVQRGADVTVNGDLTIREISRPVTLTGEYTAPMTDPWGNSRAALTVSGKINRKAWGLVWNQLLETGGLTVGEDVRLQIDVEAVAAKNEVNAAA